MFDSFDYRSGGVNGRLNSVNGRLNAALHSVADKGDTGRDTSHHATHLPPIITDQISDMIIWYETLCCCLCGWLKTHRI
jgi:hypothetical protein